MECPDQVAVWSGKILKEVPQLEEKAEKGRFARVVDPKEGSESGADREASWP
jgi:hypothetical protein